MGPLVEDRHFPADLLAHLTVLKLAEHEAAMVAGGVFDKSTAERIGVPEVLVTYGSEGCDIYVDGAVARIPPAWRVLDVQTTGAGDMFTACYVAHRAAGDDPQGAAEAASVLVARELATRR
ncbi:PfkB family carbohydrate kinase [[Mycobacterium] fortunisiensis]|uniref:PfkB family carbohydrate kinase n=1 Tax=[Mycobacterium] fortunisiensis TaxID=2600579 RepID=UPI0027E07B2A|nr:PfkB family carbohydrate kinase [[Mycobacterium] fortunisiensis]